MYLIIITGFLLIVVVSNVLFWPRVRLGSDPEPNTLISVLVPARNEEKNISTCLESILNSQTCVGEILVYDDHSVDNTAALVRAFAERDRRVRLLRPEPLPPDWCGKNFACSKLAAAAQHGWLLFLDADTRLSTGAVPAILGEAIARRLTLLSCWPGFALVNFSERALMPMLNFVVFTVFPTLLSLVRNQPSLGLAHGACLLIHRATYERLGGHGAVYNQIFEDTRLAQWWRENDERSLCLDGQDVVKVRMYANFPEIWRGFQKNFFPAFRHESVFWLFLVFHFTVFLLPFLTGNWIAAGLIIAARLLLAIRFSQAWWSVLLHPFAEFLLLGLGISSWWHCRSGKGVAWKGRVYLANRRASRT